MELQLCSNDKAIEFNALFNDVKRMIKQLKETGIDITKEEDRLSEIANFCNKKLETTTSVSDIEYIYITGIKALKDLKEAVKKHEVYYTTYNQASNIEENLEETALNSVDNKDYVSKTIEILKRIQSSDTRIFNSEEKVVNKVYVLAYKIIKRELLIDGKSAVLDWVRSDEVASSHINTLIELDIALYDSSIITNDIIREAIDTLKESSLDISYLDEGLILFFALQDDNNVAKVERVLNDILNEINALTKSANDKNYINDKLREKIKSLEESIKKSKIYKELGLYVSFLAVLIGLRYGAKEAMTHIGHNEYRTEVEYFTTEENKTKPEYPEYMEKIPGFKKATLTAYDVWHQENVFQGDYERDIVTYDLTNIDMANLEDFLTYDFADVLCDKETETREKLAINELYDKAIVEITRLKQDENDVNFVPNEELQHTFTTIISIVTNVLSFANGLYFGFKAIDKLNNKRTMKLANKENLDELEKGLEAYRELCLKNEAFRRRFLAIYERCAEYIKDPEIKEQRRTLTK